MEDQTTHKIPISQTLIQSKVLTFFNSMKAQRGEEATEEEFEVSKCWFIRCKAWSHLDNIQVRGEAASYAEALAKIINEGGYSKQQIFNVDEQPYVERRCHLGLSGWRDVNAWHQSFKGQADIMLGANAAGDLKLKPMLTYHSKNPRALNIYAKSILPVFCM